MKSILNKFSVITGILAYAYIVTTTAVGTGGGLSLSTFSLWSMLAFISGFTMLSKKANAAVPFIYAIGATATTIVLLVKSKYGWSKLDSVIAILVVICVLLWLTKGARWALIFSVLASCIASLPFIVMTWQSPSLSPIIPNAGFLLANILSFAAAKAWTFEDRLYSGANIIVCAFLVAPWVFQ